MTKHTTVFADLLSPLSRSDFYSATEGHKPDFKTRYFSTWDLLKTLLYANLSSCFSVREIETSMRVNKPRLYHTGLKEIKRSTFCDALEKRRHDIFRSVFHAIVDKAQTIAGKMKKKFSDPLRIIDASIIPLCLKRYDWAKYRKAKGAVKLHLNLDGDTHIPFDAYLTDGTVHENVLMRNLCQESGVIYVMDRGYIDYKSLYCIEIQGSIFVTRMKHNCSYRKVSKNNHAKGTGILSDEVIELTGAVTKKHYPEAMRKVKYQDGETGKIYEFLTNDMKREANEIAAIYKERWEVELFFKWIKQHLKIRSFYGTSENAVYTQLWAALILTVLLWIKRTLDGITQSGYTILIMIKSTLLSKNSLSGLCTNISLPKDESCFQPFLEGLIC